MTTLEIDLELLNLCQQSQNLSEEDNYSDDRLKAVLSLVSYVLYARRQSVPFNREPSKYDLKAEKLETQLNKFITLLNSREYEEDKYKRLSQGIV